MTITHFDRYASESFVRELKALAKDLAAKHGVVLEDEGTWRYGGDTLKVPLHFKTVDLSTGAPKISASLDYYARMHGLDYMITSYDGYQLVDYKASRPKYPWSIKNVHTGQAQKATTGWVQARFKKGMVSAAPVIPSTISSPSIPSANAAMVTDLVKLALSDDEDTTAATSNDRYEGMF